MNQSIKKIQLTCERLPLAVYREIVSHLRQIEGVNADLLPQTSKEFDYLQSQVGGLWLEYSANHDTEIKVKGILAYYENKYNSWVVINND
ncbi:MAG: hypothetical protein FWJ34_01225 [Geminocystis sp. GBBB08]|nr:hypothetical protein [Geminocystis sp. GBBB08]